MKHKRSWVFGAVAGSLLFTGAASAATILQSFSLFNHPSGAVDPQAYGLRLDQFPNPTPPGGNDGQVTFSMQDPAAAGPSTMRLDVIDTGSGINLHMTGTIWGNSANGGTYVGKYAVDVLYTNVTDVGDGWIVDDDVSGPDPDGNDVGFIGTLTAADAVAESIFGVGGTFNLDSKARGSGLVFSFRNATHRSNPGWNGFGWVNNPITGPTEDWLFRAEVLTVIPLPTSASLGLMGFAGMAIARRRRSS